MEDLDSSLSMQSLVCQEDQNLWFDDVSDVVADDDEDEATDNKHEMPVLSNGSLSSEPDTWLKCARSNAIQWIMRTKDYFGFRFETAYLSITYFDRFLMRRHIHKKKSWVVRLLSVACLSLAAKMEECVVPTLPEYDTDECRFESDAMRRMELLVLSALDWRMGSGTPFAYLDCFASKLLHAPPNNPSEDDDKLVCRSVGYIFSIIEDINLVDYGASTIAAAAILAASSDQRLTNNLLGSKLSILASCGAIENEHVMYCYALMTQQPREEYSVPPESFVCSESSSMNCADNNNICSRSSKRRRRRLQL